jgi:hypothetical protein
LSSTRQQKIIKTISAYIEMNYLLLLKFKKKYSSRAQSLKEVSDDEESGDAYTSDEE